MIFMVSSAQGITDLFDFLFVSFCRFLFSGLLSCLSFYVSTNDKKIKTKRSRIRGSEDPRIRGPSPYVRVYFLVSQTPPVFSQG